MAKSAVYQTLEDRQNAVYVEANGPFPCNKKDAWIGDGYYFWDYHFELAHWWGKKTYNSKGYIVCVGNCEINSDRCWDLHASGEHRDQFIKALMLLKNRKDRNPEMKEITVRRVIELAKKKGLFVHEAIRIYGIGSASALQKSVGVGTRLKFSYKYSHAYFEPFPPVQICLLNKNSLSLAGYRIVWPDHYIEQQVF